MTYLPRDDYLDRPLVTRRPAARDFYSVLMGWEAEDIYYDNQLVYTMLRNDGKLAAGLGKQPLEIANLGIPPPWATYVNVDDVETVATAFAANGGNLIAPPMDVMNSGRGRCSQ
jgi:hypothetical protein